MACLQAWERDFILGLSDIPRYTVDKTLYHNVHQGLGLHHSRTRHATRVLNMVERAVHIQRAHEDAYDPKSAQMLHLLDVMEHTARSMGGFMDIHRPIAPHHCAHPLNGYTVQQLPSGGILPATYTDGSYDGKRCAGAVLLSTKERYMIRTPGPRRRTAPNYTRWH